MARTVAVVITGLKTGGAEMMLLRFLQHLDKSKFKPTVLSLSTLGDIGPRISALGVPVEALGMDGSCLRIRNITRFVSLVRRLKELRPDITHTWMYHADLIGGIAATLAGNSRVIWSIHNSNLSARGSKRSTRFIVKLCARLSHAIPTTIMCCSRTAATIHGQLGYASSKFVIVPNGFDLQSFRPNPDAALSVRSELGLPIGIRLVGMVGRFDPQKNHTGFFRMARKLRERRQDVEFMLVGEGVDSTNEQLRKVIRSENLDSVIHLLGRRDDIPRLLAALDVLVSTSLYGEAFPLVVGEAMACGVPCVVTDVGDSVDLVGDCGIGTPPGDYECMAEHVHRLLDRTARERGTLAARARDRIEKYFDIRAITRKYEQVYERAIS